MKNTQNGYNEINHRKDNDDFSVDSDDKYIELVNKISNANSLERAGKIEEAKQLYQEVVELDITGNLGASAKKALENLGVNTDKLILTPAIKTDTKLPTTNLKKASANKSSIGLWQWFCNQSISRKQLIALLSSEIFSLFLIGFGVRWIIISGLQNQLVNQAKAEVAVTKTNYNIKVNQMGFGFRGQADNPAIINAAIKANQSNSAVVDQDLRNQVKKILQNEVKARQIEYATLVGKNLQIIVNANADRTGEVFNPNNLVEEVFKDPRQIKANAIVSKSELTKESPSLPAGLNYQDALIRYTVTPVVDPSSQKVIAALVSGDIVNGKLPIVQETLRTINGGYSAVYFRKPTGDFVLATALEQGEGKDLEAAQTNVALPNNSILTAASKSKDLPVNDRITIGKQNYTVAAVGLPNLFKDSEGRAVPVASGESVAFLVRGTPETTLNQLLYKSMIDQCAVFFIALLVIGIWALILRQSILIPIEQLEQTTKDFSEGNQQARAVVFAEDEVGRLAMTFNQIVDNLMESTRVVEEQSKLRQTEADFQRQQKESLQQGVINLLIDIEGAQQGDLTVRAKIDEGEMGSIADAFNATIRSLREIVLQVQTAALQLNESAFDSEASVQKLSQEATIQAEVIAETLHSVAEVGESIESVADAAIEAAAIARQALVAAQDGDTTMDETVNSIGNIRASVAATSKKVKRLVESSQEISKIVHIIAGISEKTNLLAFNASIEASRAGENGQGFRVVADEVRKLAERVTDSAKEIEQLISTIQQETAEVLQTMEASTQYVVTGTSLVTKTKYTLQELASISKKIDELLQSISSSTVSQAQASQIVNQKMQKVAAIAQTTSYESQSVSSALQQLVVVAEELQESVSKFQVK